MRDERITVFAGHYGSGKTNLAVNYAVRLRENQPLVAVADLDIVNPYFRIKDCENFLRENDIQLISSEYAGTNLDAPAMPSGTAAMFNNKSLFAVIDLGGDDRGAYALGRYSEALEAENSKNILLVINRYRPLSRTPGQIVEIRDEIERAARIKFTGLVNNSNLGRQTSADDVISSLDYGREASEITGLPLLMTSAEYGLCASLQNQIPNIFGLRIISIDKWRIFNDKD